MLGVAARLRPRGGGTVRREPPRSSAHRSALTHAGRSRCGAITFQPLRGLPTMVGRRREVGDGSCRGSLPESGFIYARGVAPSAESGVTPEGTSGQVP